MNGVDHIGIAVSSLEETLRFYTEQLGLIHMKTEEVPTQKVKVAFIDAGNVKLELLEPLDSESPVAVFIEKRGQGIHHVAFKVNNIEERIQEMKERGIRMIDEVPRPGAGGADVAFMHPKAAHGVLFELCEKSKTEGE
ncbi:methylmalonyl-CoA epimerase [Bacillus thermotolerans]|uniref:Methylmalonyl-CoA epimerase n=1 Tax=Bacillus thermotolerans TaxID=1221996 RepID=A0A0F5IBD8_BACTR|nr:methylmalonyl-CoA epimerase [Bacillus thermotolerans]KKB36225.1 Methylmalonyl-CoA epimerase [Bacillus thermotolerans]KKB37214.1 Methylmalonyl-CoA epimerase [Bacillus thermotolerans]KKB42831.1 Methylmalonyl-CoA epimerase [Bacillus thermotolerans]